MNTFYYDTVDAMMSAGVEMEYINGWISGYLHHPRRGPQHVTEAYEAGYADGQEQKADGFNSWLRAA